MSVSSRVTHFFESLKTHILGRDDVLDDIKVALTLGENVLLYGKHGTSKSLMSNLILSNIEGASLFKTQLFKEMSADYVFGPTNIPKYQKEGVLEHNIEGYLPTCTFAFLDEFFDANDNLLRSMLTCLNEREYTNGRETIRIPLRSAIASTNFSEVNDKREAVIDRFLFRLQVHPLDRGDKLKLVSGLRDRFCGKLHIDDLKKARIASSQVAIPEMVREAYIDMVEKMSGTVYVSDRRILQVMDVMRAFAFFSGRSEVNEDDLNRTCFAVVDGSKPAHLKSFSVCYLSSKEEITSRRISAAAFKRLQDAFEKSQGITEDEVHTHYLFLRYLCESEDNAVDAKEHLRRVFSDALAYYSRRCKVLGFAESTLEVCFNTDIEESCSLDSQVLAQSTSSTSTLREKFKSMLVG